MFSLRYLNGGKSERKKFSELTVNKAILYGLSKEIINDGIINNNKSRREQISDREKQGLRMSNPWGNFFSTEMSEAFMGAKELSCIKTASQK